MYASSSADLDAAPFLRQLRSCVTNRREPRTSATRSIGPCPWYSGSIAHHTSAGEQHPPCTRYPSQMHECYVRFMFLLLMYTKALTSSKSIHASMLPGTTGEGPRKSTHPTRVWAHDTTRGIPPKPHTRSTASWTAADTHVHRSVCDKTH